MEAKLYTALSQIQNNYNLKGSLIKETLKYAWPLIIYTFKFKGISPKIPKFQGRGQGFTLLKLQGYFGVGDSTYNWYLLGKKSRGLLFSRRGNEGSILGILSTLVLMGLTY